MIRALSAAALLAAAFSVHGQAEIVESQPLSRQSNQSRSAQPPPAQAAENTPSIQSELYFQLQMLQQEVLDLRGLVEEQAFEIKRLKQQRMDDYLDLDRRLGQLGQKSSRAVDTPSNATPVVPATSGSSAPEKDELASYRAAIDLVLKQRDFDGGAAALQAYLQDFPRGHYVANAQYWLGQIYFQKSDMAQSQKWFTAMIKQFPQHHKTPEAKFKLAKILKSNGDTAAAKTLLKEVAETKSSVAAMAKELLNSFD